MHMTPNRIGLAQALRCKITSSYTRIILFMSLSLLFNLPAIALADTTVNSNITTDTTWTAAASPYIVTSAFLVYGTDGDDGITTLTIEAGVEVRFNINRYMLVGSNGPGALIAQGTAADPIIFTSNQATPNPGDWQGIWLYNSTDDATTKLTHCVFEYAGYSHGAVYIYSAAPTIENCTFSNSGNYDIKFSYDIGGSVSNCTINSGIRISGSGNIEFNGNSINYNNSFPILAKAENVDNLLNGNTYNNLDADSYIEVSSGTIAHDATWPAVLPIHVKSQLTIQGTDGADGITTLTLEPGLQMKFDRACYLSIGAASGAPGALVAQGAAAQPIVFTAVAASPVAGDWCGIRIYNTSDDATTSLEHCQIDYAGYYNNAAVQITDASPNLTNCIFNNSASYDLIYAGTVGGTVSNCTINNSIKLNANSTVDFNGNTINHINSRPIIAKADSVHSLVNGNTYNNLDAGSYLDVYADTITSDATWTSAIPYYMSGTINVQGTDGADDVTTLTIEPGARLKFNVAGLNVGGYSGDPGALIAQGTSENMVLFTSSNATQIQGDWDKIHFRATAAASSLIEYCVVEYGGRYGKGALFLDNAKVDVRNSTIRDNYVYGLYISGTGSNDADIQCNTLENNGNGLMTASSALPIIQHNNFINNSSFGLRSNSTGLVAENNWWNDAAGPNQGGDKTYGPVDTDPWSTEQNQCSSGSTNNPPYQPTVPTPVDNAVRVTQSSPIILTWAGGDPDPEDTTVYDIYLGTSADTIPLAAHNVTGASYVINEPVRGITYYWQVIARDSQGLETNGPVWRFTTAGDLPDLIISNGATTPPGNLQTGESVTITATVQNNGTGPVVYSFAVDVKVDGISIGSPTVDEIMLAGQSVELSLPWTYAGGNPTVEVVADSQLAVFETDERNNQFNALLDEVADMTAPALVSTSPADGAYLQQVNQVEVSLSDTQSTVDDAAVISGLSVTDDSLQNAPGIVTESDDIFTFAPTTTPMADGTYTVSVDSTDIHGNTQNFSFAFTVDSQPPAKPVITGGTVTSGTIQARPVQNTTNQFAVELAGTREADTSVWIDGVEMAELSTTPWAVQLTLQPGDNPLEVWLKDRAGNQGASEWVDIQVSTSNSIYIDYDASGRVKRIDTTP